jgi:hypothetical protein
VLDFLFRPATGGQIITLIGTGFRDLSMRLACVFNQSISASSFASDTTILCKAPPGRKGVLLPVQIMYDNGTFYTRTKFYGYYGGISIFPSTGPYKGGTISFIQSTIVSSSNCEYDDSESACFRPSETSFSSKTSLGIQCKFFFNGSKQSVNTIGWIQILGQGQGQVLSCPSPSISINSSSILSPRSILNESEAKVGVASIVVNPSDEFGQGAAYNTLRGSGIVSSLVSFTLLGAPGFTEDADSLNFLFYPDPILEKIIPSFSSGAGGCISTIYGSGFLPFENQRLRFSGNGSVSEWSTPTYVNASVMISNVSRRCINERQRNCLGAPTNLPTSVRLAINGQQYTDNGPQFQYYYVDRLIPSGGGLEGGTPVTVFGVGFDEIVNAYPVKCMFSHNFAEIPATILSSSAVLCISPQGRQMSSVEVCIGTAYSLTKLETVGCLRSFTSNQILYVSYSLFPLVSIRPNAGPSVGGFEIAFLLSAHLYSSLQLSEEIFREYGPAGNIKCKFGEFEVLATIISSTRVVCTAPRYIPPTGDLSSTVNSDIPLAGSTPVQITLNGWDWTRTIVTLKYQIVTSIFPFGSPATCTDPPCVAARLSCDWCTAEPNIDKEVGTCRQWEPIFVKGYRIKPATITITGINLDQFFPSQNVEQGYKFPLCKLGSLNIFNATFAVTGTVPMEGRMVPAFKWTCPLPTKILMAADESPAMKLEVSLNGRDWTDSSEARKYADPWASRVNSFCPPGVARMKPSSGTSSSDRPAIVTLQGSGFDAALSRIDGVNQFAMCAFGGYAATAATVITNTLMICTAPAHPVAESLPLFISLNGDIMHPFPQVTFTYMKLNWIVPSIGPVEGGTLISLFGDNLLAILAGGSNISASYFCRFGETIVMGTYQKKLDAVSVDPRTGECNFCQSV